MKNSVWSTVVNTATAIFTKVKRPIRMWVLRPLVVIVGAIVTGILVAVWSIPEMWNSTVWTEE
jgi:hypothetical protein